MSGGVLRFPWTSQPQTIEPLNSAIGINDWTCLHVFGKPIRGTAGTVGTLINTARYAPGQGGIALDIVAAGDYLSYSGTGLALGVQSGVMLVEVTSLANVTTFFCTSITGGGNGFAVLMDSSGFCNLSKHNVADFLTSSVKMRLGLNAIAWSYNKSTGRAKLAVNGVVTSATSTQTFSHNGSGLGRYRASDTVNSFAHKQYLFAQSPSEIFSDGLLTDLTKLPQSVWQLFQPIQRTIWVPSSAPAASGGYGFKLRQPWDNQPQILTPLDPAYKAIGAYTPITSAALNQAKKYPALVAINAPTVGAGSAGLQWNFNGSSQYFSASLGAAQLEGFTIIAIGTPTNVATGGAIVTIANTTLAQGSYGIRINAGVVGAYAYSTAGAFNESTHAVAAVNNKTYVFGAVFASTALRTVYLNGTPGTPNTTSGAVTSASQFSIGVLNRSGITQYWPGGVNGVFVLPWALTDAEMARMKTPADVWAAMYAPIQRTIWVPSAAGGAFTPSITEAITLADTASQVASLSASITEAATLSHSQDAIVGYAVSNTETLNLSHSQTNVANFPATITEAMTLADTKSVQFGATSTISEAMTLADSSSNVATLSASITESMTLADSPNASASGDYTATQTEAMSLADSASNVAALSGSITEAMSLADSSSNVAALSRSISEALTLADTASSSAAGDYTATITEAVTLSDSSSNTATLSAAITESATLADTSTASSPGNFAASISESLALAEIASNQAALSAAMVEALSLADTASNVAALSASITEPMSLSDSQSNVASLSASISESMTLADTASSSAAGDYTATITEAVTLSDSSSNIATLSATITESAALADTSTASSPGNFAASISESLALAEIASNQAALSAAMVEALSLADNAAAAWSRVVALTEAMTLSDSASQALNAIVTESVWWSYSVDPQDLHYSVDPQDLTFSIATLALAGR